MNLAPSCVSSRVWPRGCWHLTRAALCAGALLLGYTVSGKL